MRSKDPPLFFVNQYGWPDGAATAQILCEVLRNPLSNRHVILLQSRGQYSAVSGNDNEPAVQVRRLRAPGVSRERKLPKLAGFLAFYCQIVWILVTRPRGSDVIVMTTPPFLNWLGGIGKKLRGGRLVTWEMDVYPEILYSTGLVKERSWFGRFLKAVTRWARTRTDLTIVLGSCMAKLVHQGGLAVQDSAELHNWANGEILHPVRTPGAAPLLRLLYSGNLGVAYDVEIIAGAVDPLRGSPVELVFAGSGAVMWRMHRYASERVLFQSACGYGELNEVLNASDIGIVTQTKASLGCVVPSKFYGILASGRGVLYVGPEQSTVAQVIRETGCGWTVALGDSEGMARLIRELEADRTRVREVGERARQVFEERFTREKGEARFWELLAGLDDKSPN